MLDTKLKNRHKLALIMILCTVFLPAGYLCQNYHAYYQEATEREKDVQKSVVTSGDFLKNFLNASMILCNEAEEEESEQVLYEYFLEEFEEYQMVYPYFEYRVEDGSGIQTGGSSTDEDEVLSEKNLSSYAFGVVLSYDEEGKLYIKKVHGAYEEEQLIKLRKITAATDTYTFFHEAENYGLEYPKEQTFYFAMTEENLQKYTKEYIDYFYYEETDIPDRAYYLLFFLMAVVAAAAWIYPKFPFWYTGGEKIFRAPLELAAVSLITVVSISVSVYSRLVLSGGGSVRTKDLLFWAAVFAGVYWGSGCLRQIRVLGVSTYIRQRSLIYKFRGILKRGFHFLKNKTVADAKRIYRWITDIDLSEKSTKIVLKLVLVNFVILTVICSLWFYGMIALVIYSVILFILLRKYCKDLKKKYNLLLQSVNRIAEGELDAEITEDLGVFTPFRAQIQKIQRGFKKAVDEEVKSQRMKADLITNVSHDLKTPLTAIITYVSLLKEETDEEKRKDYVKILEKKSLRLKALIEDLFEISKANSDNVTLNLADVDVVNLFKQVMLELDDKLKNSEIVFRCSYPEEKLILHLDGQKTYRVFENLLVNVSKYAMPHTRAYVEIRREEKEAVICVKNVSAAELTFNPEEITERFVRGDVSRNTEGSGLGLAIAKSFTELQKGTFKIETDADLFKVEIRFPYLPKP